MSTAKISRDSDSSSEARGPWARSGPGDGKEELLEALYPECEACDDPDSLWSNNLVNHTCRD